MSAPLAILVNESEGGAPADYQTFLRSKLALAPLRGLALQAHTPNPLLKGHQQAAAQWALNAGSGLVAASFGLGKTRIQCEIAGVIVKQTQAQFLVVCPLGVKHHLERKGKKFHNPETGREVQTALSTEVRYWKTPQGTDGEGGVMEMREGTDGHYKLRDHATNWATPLLGDFNGREYQRDHGEKGKERPTLSGTVKHWMTPQVAVDAPNKKSHSKIKTSQAGQAKNWSTPRTHTSNSPKVTETMDYRGRLENQNLIFQSSPPDPTPTTPGETSFLDFLSLLPPSQKRLNPTFCEWLMGLPLGWTNHDTKTNLPAWEMRFRPLLQHLLSAYWQSDLE